MALSDKAAARLEIVKALLPLASRLALDNPQQIVDKATILEQYVLKDVKAGDSLADLSRKAENRKAR